MRGPSFDRLRTGAACKKARSSVLELERDLQAHAIRLDLAVGDCHVLLADLGHAQSPVRCGGARHGGGGGLLAGGWAGADDLDDLVDAFCHLTSLLCTAQEEWRTGWLGGREKARGQVRSRWRALANQLSQS